MNDLHTDTMSPLEAGIAFGLAGHLLDSQTDRLLSARSVPVEVEVHVTVEQPAAPRPVLVNAAAGKPSLAWNAYVGQEPMKRELRVAMVSATKRKRALDHVLLASGLPGVGKTTMARLIAAEMGVELIMLVPPFNLSTLYEAAQSLPDNGVLFIDEIHQLTAGGGAGALNLYHMLEEKRLYLDSGMVQLNDITVIGATTDVDLLPEPLITRFPLKPTMHPYSNAELVRIAVRFAAAEKADLSDDLLVTIALACQGIPRIARELVATARDLTLAFDVEPTSAELLDHKQLDPDGMGRSHRDYLLALLRHGHQVDRATGEDVYRAGEETLRTLLRETKQGMGRLERALMDGGLVDRTSRGRALTPAGIARALTILAETAR